MTSALNRHQLLNGNKSPLILLMFLLVFQGCFLFKQKESDKEKEMETEVIKTDEGTEPSDTTESPTAGQEDSLAIDQFYKKKDTYKITLLLPLNLDSLKIDTVAKHLFSPENEDPEEDSKASRQELIPKECRLGLSFYEGFVSAIDTLEKYDAELSVSVFDTKKSRQHVKKLFIRDDVRSSDFIIGPVFNDPLTYAAKKAKELEVPLVSPLSPEQVTDGNNPYFYMANPRLNTHLDTLHTFLQRKHQNARKIILHQDKGFEQEKVDYISQLDCQKGDTTIDSDKNCYKKFAIPAEETVQAIDSSFVNSLLVKDTTNVVMVPSFDEAFINIVSRQLYRYSANKNIVLYGMPSWIEMSTLRLDYLDSLKLHFTSSDHLNYNAEHYKRYERAFVDSFHKLPPDVSIKAFDLTVYFGRLINQYGLTFWRQLPPSSPAKGLMGSFNFYPRRDSVSQDSTHKMRSTRIAKEKPNRKMQPDSSIKFFENRSVYMKRYKNFRLIRLKD